MSDDSNINGRGAEILLPPQGNPFKRPAGDAPADQAPGQAADHFGSLDGQGKAAVGLEEGRGGVEEPADLTPEDIAAMFPASADERNSLPPASLADPGVHMGARAAMIAPNTNPGRQPDTSLNFASSGADPRDQTAARANINLSIFNPDQPIGAGAAGSNAHMSARGPLTGGDSNVDITAFNPDQPIDATAGQPADAPASPAPDAGAVTSASSADTAAPAPADSGAPAASPSDSATASSTAAPAVGFQPFDPFAPAGGRPPVPTDASAAPMAIVPPAAAQPATAVPVDPPPAASPVLPATVGVAMAVPSPAAGGAVVVKTAVSTADDDDGPHLPAAQHNENLPHVPSMQLPVLADTGIVTHLITDERVDALWKRIDAAEQLAINDDVSPPDQRTENLEHIKAARNLLFGGRENYEDALRYVAEVESDIHYATKVRQWSYSYGTVVLFYNILWLAILGAGYAVTPFVTNNITQTHIIEASGALTIWLTILAGGLGGVSKSLFSLHQHVTKQDFDKQHLMWYYTSPILGVVLGIFVWAFVKLIVLGGAAMAGLVANSTASVSTDFVYYLLAWVVGFQQNLVLKLVEKVKDTLLPEDADKPANAASTIPPNAPPPVGGG